MLKGNYLDYLNSLDEKVKYIVIMKSQIINGKINNGTKVTNSFFDFVNKNYEQVFVSSKNDIFIFKINN